jgi:hypothetical protein
MSSGLCWDNQFIIIASKDPTMIKQGTVGMWKHVTLMMPQKREIIWRLESGESWNVFMAVYNIGSPVICDIKKQGPVKILYGTSETVKDLRSDRH